MSLQMLVWTSAVAILVAGVVAANDVFIDDNEAGGNTHHHKVRPRYLTLPRCRAVCKSALATPRELHRWRALS